jgi:hypothetical protein
MSILISKAIAHRIVSGSSKVKVVKAKIKITAKSYSKLKNWKKYKVKPA